MTGQPLDSRPADDNNAGDQHTAVRITTLGAFQDLTAAVLCLPAGLISAAILSRYLGPDRYGVLTVSLTLIFWIEVCITAGLSRTTIKFVASARNWRPVAAGLINAQIVVALLAACLMLAMAPLLAKWLRSPELTSCLRLLALDIPIFAVAQIHRAVLIGRGQFARRAALTTVQPITRALLILLLVAFGVSIKGAILAHIGGSLLLLILARIWVHPPVRKFKGIPLNTVRAYALPIFLFTISIHLLQNIDLWLVKALLANADGAGYYSAAQNVASLSGLISAALAPVLLATLSKLSDSGCVKDASHLSSQTLRLAFCLLPGAAAIAGSAEGVVAFIYGEAFAPAAPLLKVLIFAGVGRILIGLLAAILTAARRPDLPAKWIALLAVLALLANWWLIPRHGMLAAAAVSAVMSWLSVAGLLAAGIRATGIRAPWPTAMRSLIVAAAVWAAMHYLPAPGLWWLAKSVAGMALGAVGLILVGELRLAELQRWYVMLQRR